MRSKKTNARPTIEEFWQILHAMKAEPRRGWSEKLGIESVESVADHSYAVAMLSLYEAARRGGGYDLPRLLQLALLHDLDEAITGDFTPQAKQKFGPVEVSRRRRAAERKILTLLPQAMRSDWRRLWTDLRLRRTREARLVKEMDLLELALQARAYVDSGAANRLNVEEFYKSALDGIEDRQARLLVRRLAIDTSERKRRLRQ